MSLGICDWGIGGLGLYDLLKRSRPDISTVYIGDQGSTPYSLMSRPELADRVHQVLLTFRELGVTRVVFACDAASTSLDEVSVAGVSATGVIDPTLRAMKSRRYKEVGVIGGRRTILSGAYGRALRKQRFCVLQRVSLDLSTQIEKGISNDLHTREIIESVLEPLAKVDGLVLACTHYRLVSSTIQEILPGAELIDPVEATVAELIPSIPASEGELKDDVFLTTGDPQAMQRRAKETFGLDLNVEAIRILRPGMAA